MTNLLRVLDLLEKADIKALECEIPTELLKGLNIQEDGTVNLETLLKICHRANRLDAFEQAKKEKRTQETASVSFEKNPDFMDLIFNPDIAKEFSVPQKP
jgi:hypothetical protein